MIFAATVLHVYAGSASDAEVLAIVRKHCVVPRGKTDT